MIRITARHFCAGADLLEGTLLIGGVVAPIINYMRGWHLNEVYEYCERKGWQVELLSSTSKQTD